MDDCMLRRRCVIDFDRLSEVARVAAELGGTDGVYGSGMVLEDEKILTSGSKRKPVTHMRAKASILHHHQRQQARGIDYARKNDK